MAKTQVVSFSFTCDVCGNAIAENDGDASRKVSWEGKDYVVDVCATHSSTLGDLLGQLSSFVDAGTRAGPRRGRRPGSSPKAVSATAPPAPQGAAASTATVDRRADMKAVREWAQANGHKVGDRGRIPADIVAAYDAANGASGVSSPDATPEPEANTVMTPPRKSRAVRKAAASQAPIRRSLAEPADLGENGAPPKATPRKRGPRKAAAAV